MESAFKILESNLFRYLHQLQMANNVGQYLDSFQYGTRDGNDIVKIMTLSEADLLKLEELVILVNEERKKNDKLS